MADWVGHAEASLAPMLTFAIPVFAAYRFMPLRRRYALCLLALLAAGTAFQERGAERLLLTRGFFGVPFEFHDVSEPTYYTSDLSCGFDPTLCVFDIDG